MDSLMLHQRTIDGEPILLAAVCDGVGSMADGAYASSYAVHALTAWFEDLPDAGDLPSRLSGAVQQIHSSIREATQREQLKTATTLSALLIFRRRFSIIHAGDSRIYGYAQGVLTLLTRDDVTQTGRLTACVGSPSPLRLYSVQSPALYPLFLLCSDGLYKKMSASFFLSEVGFARKKELKKTICRLTQHVIDNGERDNISLALIATES